MASPLCWKYKELQDSAGTAPPGSRSRRIPVIVPRALNVRSGSPDCTIPHQSIPVVPVGRLTTACTINEEAFPKGFFSALRAHHHRDSVTRIASKESKQT
jgi:hypothetical protein